MKRQTRLFPKAVVALERLGEKGAVVVYKNGTLQQLWHKFARPRMIFNRGNPPREDIPIPRADTYYLTPTGRVEVLSNHRHFHSRIAS